MAEDIGIRQATVDDVPVIVHHRRAMFTDMGHTDPAALGAMDASFAPCVVLALSNGLYRGWLLYDETQLGGSEHETC
jgi:hypothetical protein